jgi:hypothetical protein
VEALTQNPVVSSATLGRLSARKRSCWLQERCVTDDPLLTLPIGQGTPEDPEKAAVGRTPQTRQELSFPGTDILHSCIHQQEPEHCGHPAECDANHRQALGDRLGYALHYASSALESSVGRE